MHILKALLSTAEAEFREALGTFDPGLRIAVEDTKRPSEVFDPDEMKRVMGLRGSLSHGVLSMSPDIPGLVQTSTNLASIRTAGT